MSGLVALVLALLLIAVGVLVARAVIRWFDTRISDDYEPKHQAGISLTWGAVLVTIGAAIVVASTFVKFAAPPSETVYPHHTIIGTPFGFIVAGLGVATVVAACAYVFDAGPRWTALGLALGSLLAIGRSIFLYADFQHELIGVGSSNQEIFLGSGAYLGLVGAAVAVLGSVLLGFTRPRIDIATSGAVAPSTPEANEETKVCPDCAETVKSAAQVCRYCSYRFAPKTSAR